MHSTENSIYKILFGLHPYPEGVERERIGAAFSNFFNTLETEETDLGVALRSAGGKRRVPANHFNNIVDQFFAGEIKRGSNQIMMDSPSILKKLGKEDSRYVVVNEAVLHKVAGSLHQINKEALKALPREIAAPVAVFASADPQSRNLVFLTSFKDDVGDPVLAVIRPSVRYDQTMPGGAVESYSVDILTSAYGKQNIYKLNRWAGEGLLRYADKEKIQNWLAGSDTKLPSLEQAVSDNPNILTPADLVNKKDGGPTSLKHVRTADETDRLHDELPLAHLADVTDGATGGELNEQGELHLTPEDGELVRRFHGELQAIRRGSEAEEQPFDGITIDAGTLRQMASVGPQSAEEMKLQGYPEKNVASVVKLANNLGELADRADDFGIAYVFDDSLPEERFHQKDRSLTQ